MDKTEKDPVSITLRSTLQDIEADASRYQSWISHPGFWVTLSYRMRRLRKTGSICHKLLFPIDISLGIIRSFISDTVIPSAMNIGPGLYLPHPNGIILSYMARIESHVAVFQQVTLGEWHGKAPVIESNCSLFAGAKVFGGVTIGKFCKIGANCAVGVDVPEYSSVSIGGQIVRQRERDSSIDVE